MNVSSAPSAGPTEKAEVVYLSLILTLATILNATVLIRLLRQSRSPTAHTSFLAGPYHISSFTLFKLNLCITDFCILLLHTFGKIIWLSIYYWPWGNAACKIYQCLSIFSFYANSNVVVAIGLDRLKVVYTSHVQGATSVRRVRCMLFCSWILAGVCSIPQIFIWETFQVDDGWEQCTNVFAIWEVRNQSTPQTHELAMWYEVFHQTAVFWIPFVILCCSYLLIVFRLIHFTLRPTCTTPRVPSSYQNLLLEMTTLQKPSWDKSPSPTQRPFRCFPSFTLPPQNGLPMWRRQLRSRVFLTALMVVVAHIAMWLPYNVMAALRFVNESAFESLAAWGALLEDLIVVNSLVNPLLYSYPCT